MSAKSQTSLFLSFFILSQFLYASFSFANDNCLNLFKGSLRHYQGQAGVPYAYLPQFRSLEEEVKLSKEWQKQTKKGPSVLADFLPKDVSFISYALRESPSLSLVKFQDKGSAMILRAAYHSANKKLETNVTVTDWGLANNPGQEQKWLIGPQAQAGILFLHGGGTKSTGGHVAHSLINHFRKHNVAVVSPDLPWHGQGPRTIMGDLDAELLALGDFVKKYVHPKVPLFVWGHSWGGSLAHRIMQMTGEKEKDFFHTGLKGLLITSPAIDPAPGKPISEKKSIYLEKRKSVFAEKQDQIAPSDLDIFTGMVLDGKTSPVGEFFSSLTISQLNDQIPDHKGKDYLPALMIVGEGDPLVYVGFEDLFHQYYDSLENVETHYLQDLPTIKNPNKVERVGHLLSDYSPDSANSTPVNYKLALDFMQKMIPQMQKRPSHQDSPFLTALNLFSNDLAFREWLKEARIIDIKNNQKAFQQLREEQKYLNNQIQGLITEFHPFLWIRKELDAKLAVLKNNPKSSLEAIETIKVYFKDFENFIKHTTYTRFNEELEQLTESTPLKEAIERLLEKKFLPENIGTKSKREFLKELHSASEIRDLTIFFNKYFYIPQEAQEKIQALVTQKNQIEDKIKELSIPKASDFESLNLSSEKINTRIASIKENVQKRKELTETKNELKKEIQELKTELNKNLTKMKGLMREVRDTFERVNLNPLESLKDDYQKSAEEFEKLYHLSKSLADKMEEEANSAIESQNFNMANLEASMRKHQEEIDAFFQAYNTFTLNRKSLREKLIDSVRRGDLTTELADIFNKLYGDLGLYKRTDSLSLRLAEKETKLTEVSLKEAQLLEAYQKHMPSRPLSVVSIIPIQEILNSSIVDEEFIQDLLGAWKSLGSAILPPLPE